MSKDVPKRGSRWTHRNHHMKYTFLFLTNEMSKNENHQVMAIYIEDNGNLWSRPLSTWYDSMERIEDE